MRLEELLREAIKQEASDVHLTVGVQPILRKHGRLVKLECDNLCPQDMVNYVEEILDEEQKNILYKKGDVDFSLSLNGIGRFRVNIFKQRGTYGLAIRIINHHIPKIEELGLPTSVANLASKSNGLVLVTGPTGSGKSTTLAALINKINEERDCHILTLEDPIEYLHKHNKSIVNQREIGSDAESFATALKASLREDPDVILVGEMRDIETISIAITAAETGHLVLSTLHTIGAANTIERIVDVFPPHQQQQIRTQLALVIQGIVSQQLIPTIDGKGRVAAFEVLLATAAVRNLIREGKTHQIDSLIQMGAKHGMKTMDGSLQQLIIDGRVKKTMF